MDADRPLIPFPEYPGVQGVRPLSGRDVGWIPRAFTRDDHVKIDRVELREIRMPLREPFQTSTGVSHDRRVLLVALHSGGIAAWGECVAGETPAYSYETTDTAWSILTGLILPRVSGTVMESSTDLLPVFEGIRGHPMARAAVEMAAWDLEAKAGGLSLASLIGGVRDSVPVGVSIGLQRTDEELHRKVADYLGGGVWTHQGQNQAGAGRVNAQGAP